MRKGGSSQQASCGLSGQGTVQADGHSDSGWTGLAETGAFGENPGLPQGVAPVFYLISEIGEREQPEQPENGAVHSAGIYASVGIRARRKGRRECPIRYECGAVTPGRHVSDDYRLTPRHAEIRAQRRMGVKHTELKRFMDVSGAAALGLVKHDRPRSTERRRRACWWSFNSQGGCRTWQSPRSAGYPPALPPMRRG